MRHIAYCCPTCNKIDMFPVVPELHMVIICKKCDSYLQIREIIEKDNSFKKSGQMLIRVEPIDKEDFEQGLKTGEAYEVDPSREGE